MGTSNKYFAQKSAKEVVGYITEMRQDWTTNLARQGLRERWRKSYNLYFGAHFESKSGSRGNSMTRTGSQGEVVAFAVNHYRNLIKNTLALTCKDKPSYDVRAINTDTESANAARLGNSILESDYKFKKIGEHLYGLAERSQIFGKATGIQIWDKGRGRPHTTRTVMDEQGQPKINEETGQPHQVPVYEGDIMDRKTGPYDVLVDQGLEEYNERQWMDARLYECKWDLAAQFHGLQEQIEALPNKNEIDILQTQIFNQTESDTSQVPVYHFIHKRTPAMPNGRYIMYCNEDVILMDIPCPPPYDEQLPDHRIVPGEIFGSTEGFSDAFDLQGIQEAINTLFSIGFTNLNAQGIQKLWVPDGANLSSSTLAKGLAIIRTPMGMEPKPLQLTANPQDLYTAITTLVKSMESISGVNSVARGDPEHSLKSGIAIAYVQAMAVQYQSAFQQAWANLQEEHASFRLNLYQQYAQTERVVDLVGKRNAGYTAAYTGDKLKGIKRVVVDIANPLMKTLGGKMQIAENWLEKGLIKTPQDYLTFVETGQIGFMSQGLVDKSAAIEQENQNLMEGKPVQAIPGEPHLLHMQKHMEMIENPDIKMNSPIVQAVLNHIMEHKQIKMTQDPIFDILSGEPPLPPPPPPPGMGPPPGPPGPGGPPPGPPGPPPPHPPGPPSPPQGPHHPPHPPHPPHPGGGLAEQMQPPSASPHIPRLPANLQPGAQH